MYNTLSRSQKLDQFLIKIPIFIFLFSSIFSSMLSNKLNNLPQISFAKLYNLSHVIPSSETVNQSKTHDDSIVIQSPFYERHQQSKGPCECAYHRMKRCKQVQRIEKSESNHKMKAQIQRYKSRIVAAIKNQKKSQSKPHLLQIKKLKKEREEKQNNADNISDKKVNLKRKERRKEDLDIRNQLFEEILRQRIKPLEDSHRANNLVRFIKMEVKTVDKQYLLKIRDRIYFHLQKVVKKLGYSYLRDFDWQSEEGILKLRLLLNVTRQIAEQFVKGVQKAIIDMESYLKQKQKNLGRKSQYQGGDQLFPSTKDGKDVEIEQKWGSGERPKIGNGDQVVGHKSQKQIGWEIIKKDSIFENIEDSKTNEGKSLFQKQSILNNLFNRVILPQKKHHQSNEDNTGRTEQFRTSGFASLKSDRDNALREKSINNTWSKSNLSNSIKGEGVNGRNEGQNEKSRFFNSQKPSHQKENKINMEGRATDVIGSKSRKGSVLKYKKKKTLMEEAQNPDPFLRVKYSPLLSVQQFEKIKSALKDSSEQRQKMERVFGIIQRRISGRPSFLKEFIEKFSEVLTEEQIQLLKEKENENNLKKMISKLTKKIDLCLVQLKNSEETLWREDQEVIVHKKIPVSLKKSIVIQQIKIDNSLLKDIQNFKIIEKPQTNEVEKLENNEMLTDLQQKEIGQLRIIQQFPIGEGQQKSLGRKPKRQGLQYQFSHFCITQQRHRQILKYLHKRYPKLFNQIKQNLQQTLQTQF